MTRLPSDRSTLLSSAARWAASLLLVAGLWPPVCLAGSQAPSEQDSGARTPALTIAEGSVARDQVVALGRDLVVAGQALADVAAVGGTVEITGEVVGDVIVLGGGARLGPRARVGGDVYALGGAIDAAPGASIAGRSAAYPDASAAWLALLEAPTLGADAAGPLILGAKLALLTAWLALVLICLASAGGSVLSTSRAVAAEPFRCFGTGLTGVLALVLTALLISAFSPALVSLPMLVLVVFAALLLKFWGMVAVFHALGAWLGERLLGRRLAPINSAALGLAVLGAIKLVPWVGLWVWYVATFIGVGAALVSKLGSRRPWFEIVPDGAAA